MRLLVVYQNSSNHRVRSGMRPLARCARSRAALHIVLVAQRGFVRIVHVLQNSQFHNIAKAIKCLGLSLLLWSSYSQGHFMN